MGVLAISLLHTYQGMSFAGILQVYSTTPSPLAPFDMIFLFFFFQAHIVLSQLLHQNLTKF